jgi:hypothetical protein
MEFLPGHWSRGRPRRSRAARRLPRGRARGAAVVATAGARVAARRRRHGGAAARSGDIQQPGCASPQRCTGGPAEGAEQRRWVGGAEAGPRDGPGAPRMGEGWWGRGGRLASGFCSAAPIQRQGRAIRGRAAHRERTRARGAEISEQFDGASNEPIFAAFGARGAAPRRLQCARAADATAGSHHTRLRLTGRARGRAGRQNASNSPPHPTSLFSPQSARGEPRHASCSALATMLDQLFSVFFLGKLFHCGEDAEVTVNNAQYAVPGIACTRRLFSSALARGR